jgi:hypothetical protein
VFPAVAVQDLGVVVDVFVHRYVDRVRHGLLHRDRDRPVHRDVDWPVHRDRNGPVHGDGHCLDHRNVNGYLNVYRDWLSHRDGYRMRDGHRHGYRMRDSNQDWHSHWLADFHSVTVHLRSAVVLLRAVTGGNAPLLVSLFWQILQVLSNGY